MKFSKEDMFWFYRKMVELRFGDDRLLALKLKDLVMNGFHPYAGEEAVAAGVGRWLIDGDYVASTHRPQGHAVATGSSLRSIFCEMLGRMGGGSNGLGGPMQWVDAEDNFFCGSIVGSGISYATGFGLALKRKGEGNVCVCFFGDGASNTGSFHEGMNLASLWKLPVVYICENNQYGEAMPVKDYVPVENISQRAASYGMDGVTVDGMDVCAVAEAASRCIEEARAGKRPALIEAVTYRFRGHYIGDPENYRTKDEIEAWRKRDPVPACRQELIEKWGVSEDELDRMEKEIEKKVDEDQAWALEQPKPTLEYAVGNVLVPIGENKA